ncbi:MAG: VWA domain-containing protein [Acidobacteria bacterium]|nr:VWA domain-containing protein [Acidobacteriota bacterium]MBI3424587.1 VWA domain-containing protein [Acidobacteriota bacterium]
MNRKLQWLAVSVAVALLLCLLTPLVLEHRASAQAGRQSGKTNKKNPGASGESDEQKKEEQKVDKTAPTAAVTISTDVVNVEAVVYNKKTGAVIRGLKKEDFEIYEDGIKQEVENFATPEAPVTMVLLLEYSKLIDVLGSPAGGYFEYGRVEILRPAYEFVSRFVQPKDFISVVAFDIRPTPIVDFTDDKNKLMGAIQLLIRNNPAFSESNFFDALKFVLRGGKGDAVVLEEGKQQTDKKGQADYAGLYEVNARTAILYIGSGLDTFSKINFDEARKIVENSGVPIYVIGTGNLFLKLYDQALDPGRGTNINGIPLDRMTMLQAQNTLKTFATSTGGQYFPITFSGEIPSTLQSISALVRNQYSLGYIPTNTRKEGKRRKIQVKANLGDKIDPKLIVIQHRQTYVEAKETK